MLSATELEDLTTRCKYAQAHGIQIALAEDYARELGYAGEKPPVKTRKFSPAHLLHLIEAHKKKAAAQAQPAQPKAAAKVAKVSKAKTQEPAPKEEDIPTVPVDIRAVHAAVEAMRSKEPEIDLEIPDSDPTRS